MEKVGYLGCDVSKGYADFLLLGPKKEVLEANFQLDDSKPGRKVLSEIIENWFSSGLETLYCGVESTGGYENNWYSYFQKLGVSHPLKVARLNPRGVKSVSEAAMKRTVTDAVSAENIAVYLMSFPEKIVYSRTQVDVDNTFKEARQCVSFKRMQIKQKVQLNNQLEKLLYQYFSEVLVYCRHGIPNWLLRLLVKYPSAKQVKAAGEKGLGKIKGISSLKAKALLAKVALSDQQINQVIKHTISETAKEILHKKSIIDKESLLMVNEFKDDPQVKLLCSIKGIGPASAVSIMLEIESIQKFASAKQLCSFFGVHPTFKQSGDGVWASRLSKKGRGEIRAVLYMCCLSAIRSDENLKQLYARFRAKGMNHYQAMGVVMHKMLRVIYGVLKNKTAYDLEIDRKNVAMASQKREQAKTMENETKLGKTRRAERFITPDQDAPISRRAAQKRKKQKMPQSSLTEECAGSNSV